MQFTENQRKAIDLRDKNILVSAAAGSGKTAVLVTRIIERIVSEENPIDIDRILVMTFTKAAAAQMKERILKAIEEKKKDRPFDKNLQKQSALIHNANITTIDSFCLNVVRNHFSEIDLNPDFRLADKGECNLLKRDVLNSIMEGQFEKGDENFLLMTETFAPSKNDSEIDEMVLKLFGFSLSYPDPKEWLISCKEAYSTINKDNFEDTKWVKEYVKLVKSRLSEVRSILDKAGDITQMEYGPLPYAEAIDSDIEFLDNLISKNSYADLYNCLQESGGYSPAKLKQVKLPKEGEASEKEIQTRTELKEKVAGVRKKTKTVIDSVIKTIMQDSVDSVIESMNAMSAPVSELIDTVILFSDEFEKKKREKNVVDFSDLEHMTLDILKNSESASREYKDFFKEIYVDEYQDSNLVQEEILKYLCSETDNSGNLFMVGDVKQSIYGFRLARPEIFIEKYNRFPSELNESPDIKIDLHDNFRSRTHVINSVNDVFSRVMTKESGKIIYDENAALHAGASYEDGDGYNTELITILKDEELDDKELEAKAIAVKIKEIVGTLDVKGEDDEIRKARYSDIVILLRTAKGWDTVFKQAIEEMGIPIHVDSSTGYFSRPEVATILEYLKIIDNPLQDIPLMACLRSEFGGFYDEEVAEIRGAFKEGYLYDSINQYLSVYGENEDFNVITTKIRKFLDELNHYRSKMAYVSVDRIISEIIDGTYGKCILSKTNGKKMFANLNVLLDKAIQYGKTSYKGLFHFNRYIEMLHKFEEDFGEAGILDEKDDAVRIMSIHKSKGLEFPVCFIAGMKKKFNLRDSRDSIVMDSDYGLGVNIINPIKRTKRKSLYKSYLSEKKNRETLEEELRLLYVAMTRAKEKLIMTTTITENEFDSEVMLTKAESYLDLYKYARSLDNIKSIDLIEMTSFDVIESYVSDVFEIETKRERIKSILQKEDTHLPDEIMERINYEYPYANEKKYEKVSVSELKRRSMAIKEQESREYIDDTFLLYSEENDLKSEKYNLKSEDNDQKSYSPALRGTAIHRTFELWDYSLNTDLDTISSFIDTIKEKKRIESDLVPYINKYIIHDFVNSDIARRMKIAADEGKLWREQPFVIEDKDEGIIVQGIIDAYFFEGDEVVVVDYKTDRVSTKEELVEKYKVQLDYYSKALEMLTRRKVKEKVIYSTQLKDIITM